MFPQASGVPRHRRRAAVACAVVVLGWPGVAAAQHEHPAGPAAPGWSFQWHAQAFLNANMQERRFRDFHVVESQNWLMIDAGRPVGRGRFSTQVMFSAEEWTTGRYGSPQVFQTGETFGGAALLDYQHPHDLVMAANVRWQAPIGAGSWFVEAGPVAAPALGPVAFMHRASAGANPTAPLGHHNLDAVHISHTVVTVGASRGAFTIEASGFHGREPDEDRVAVEAGPIDSYAARVSWRRGGWSAQVSAGHLKFPDVTEFTDHDLFTASLTRSGTFRGRPIDWTIALGVNREAALGVTTPTVLAEGAWQAGPRDQWYARAELMRKDILTPGGYDPPGFEHPHVLSRIGALTIGYERELARTAAGRFGLGADATVYARDANLADNYGRPFSAHVFLRYSLIR